jgi:hypothetical protein
MGYTHLEQHGYEVNYATHHHSRPFVKAGSIKIELHHTIQHASSAFKICVDGLWRRAQPAPIGNTHVLVLSPEDLLLHLCLHTAFDHHFLFGLRSFCDLFEVIRHYRNDIDWDELVHRSREWATIKYVYLALALATELLEAEVPEEVLADLKPEDFDPQVIGWSLTQIFTDASPAVSENLARVWGAQEVRQRVALLVNSLLPSPTRLAQMYHLPLRSAWVYLYYPQRWKDLLVRYGCSLWRLLRGDYAIIMASERENEKRALREWLRAAQ